jgi:predicted amidohydrolase YtcJ
MKHVSKIISLLIICVLYSCETPDQADLIVHNAKIYTVNDLFDIAEAMVVKDGKIIAIGAEHEIMNKYHAKEVIDAKKQTIYPGFIDAHCHFISYALSKQEVNLIGTKSYKEVVERVQKFAKTNNSQWIIGRGWDQNDWEVKEFPNRFELDLLFPNTPILLTRIDGHAALANKKALEIANINAETKIDGGIITFMVEQNGSQIQFKSTELNSYKNLAPQPTGILIDNAIDYVSKHISKKDKSIKSLALLEAQNDLFKVGLTTIDDAGLNKDDINLIDELQQQNKLKIKVYAMISGNEEMLNYYLKKGPYKTNKLSVCSFKFYADGALGSRGACLIEPYSDIIEQQHYGLLLNEEAFFNKYAPLLYEKGFQMNTHCIGDSANRLILDVYAKVLKGVNDKRWRIEHAQVIHPTDFDKFKNYTIIPSIQSTHATSDMYWAKDRLGSERVKHAYAYQDLLKQNGIVALGTDFPVEGINPINTFYAAVVRKDNVGFPKDGFQIENALTREEALKGMTIWAAIANFEETEKGSLEVGKSADFVILNNDIIKTNEENILKVKVVKTFINGETVYSHQ